MNQQTTLDQGLKSTEPLQPEATTMPLPPMPLPLVSGPFASAAATPTVTNQPAVSIPQSVVPSAPPPILEPTIPAHSAGTVTPGNSAAGTTSRLTGNTPPEIAPLPVEAADIDVIEKEWVYRAKHVVNQTRQDPYRRMTELNKLKADYMKKRYNKDIKIADA